MTCICDTHQVHDVDELKQRLSDEGLAWLGTKCHRRSNVYSDATQLDVELSCVAINGPLVAQTSLGRDLFPFCLHVQI